MITRYQLTEREKLVLFYLFVERNRMFNNFIRDYFIGLLAFWVQDLHTYVFVLFHVKNEVI